VSRACDPCAPSFPTPRDEYGWARDGGDDVPAMIRRYPVRAGTEYVPEPEPTRRLGEPGEHAERGGGC
jgi:hypothetical protein